MDQYENESTMLEADHDTDLINHILEHNLVEFAAVIDHLIEANIRARQHNQLNTSKILLRPFMNEWCF
jgi:hypothetical protein